MADGRLDRTASEELGATGSGWTFNWRGALSLLVVGVIVLVAWRWFGGSAMGSDESDPDVAAVAVSTLPPLRGGDGTTTTTSPPTTTTSPPTTTTSTTVPERAVQISGEMKPCRFGSNCLVASFTILGFDEHPGRFACIYPNSRRDFGFNRDTVDDACMTADAGDTIAIEVDGVVSATISEQNLDGA